MAKKNMTPFIDDIFQYDSFETWEEGEEDRQKKKIYHNCKESKNKKFFKKKNCTAFGMY